ncbi:MAG: AsmA-like C-terminal region-containing protein, partial [Pseudomonadota bacterium]
LTLLPTGDPGQFDGTLRVRGVRVQDAPTIAALLDAISVVGLLQQLDGQGLAFDEVDASFRLTPAQVIVSQASAVGPGLGISVDGTYTLASRQLDLQGVVSPFYLVNSIGSFLTRKGEGLIGFNFNIGGTVSAPQVLVNPLSALTPGMFREIFRRPAPELSQ